MFLTDWENWDMKKTVVFVIAFLAVSCFSSCGQGEMQDWQAMPLVVLENVSPAAYMFYNPEDGLFELPVAGATGWAAIYLPLHEAEADGSTRVVGTLPPGQGFTILEAHNGWWYILVGGTTGWVMSRYCMINLPDILPSMVFNITNHASSLFRSSGRVIPKITGRSLYNSRDFNARFGREKYIAAVLYGMAGKIAAAQRAALADGNTLIMYEAFRPAQAHNLVYESFHDLVNTDPVVRAGVSTPPWNTRWFLAASPYNHQRGTAIDVSLARIDQFEVRSSGDFAYIHVTRHTPHRMQTPMHEMSIDAVVFSRPVHSRSLVAWKQAEFSERATPGTILMHRYLTDAGLIPLASEWWHFNDLVHTAYAIEWGITGEFFLDSTYSMPPWLTRE